MEHIVIDKDNLGFSRLLVNVEDSRGATRHLIFKTPKTNGKKSQGGLPFFIILV
jgi:hypothetical protein